MLLALLLGASGCAGSGRTTKAPPRRAASQEIVEFHVVTLPVALNLDSSPGPDAVAVKLFAVGSRDAKSARLGRGSVELQLFDGLLTAGERPPAPLRTWTLSPEQLRPFEQDSVIGTHYQLSLRWESAVPTRERVTLVGILRLPDGRVLASAPAVVSLGTGR